MKKIIINMGIAILLSIAYSSCSSHGTKEAKNESGAASLGIYNGIFGLGDSTTEITTKFHLENDKIIGEYSYRMMSGKFMNCVLVNHKFTSEWKDSDGTSGKFDAIFNDDFTEFIGAWHFNSNKYGGSWTGKK